MNNTILMGRLTRDPEVKNAGDTNKVVARYTLAVTRSWSNAGKEETDFIPCVAFSKAAEFASRFLKQGMKIAIRGRLQTGSFIKDGHKIFTMDVIVDEQHLTGKPSTSKLTKDGQDEAAGSNIPFSDELPIE